jgi:hypothetical protein
VIGPPLDRERPERRRYHLSYPRDGGPVGCRCAIGADHDAEDPVPDVTSGPATVATTPTLEDVITATVSVVAGLWAALEPIARAALASFAVLWRQLNAAHDADHERFHARLAAADDAPRATCPLCSAPLNLDAPTPPFDTSWLTSLRRRPGGVR